MTKITEAHAFHVLNAVAQIATDDVMNNSYFGDIPESGKPMAGALLAAIRIGEMFVVDPEFMYEVIHIYRKTLTITREEMDDFKEAVLSSE